MLLQLGVERSHPLGKIQQDSLAWLVEPLYRRDKIKRKDNLGSNGTDRFRSNPGPISQIYSETWRVRVGLKEKRREEEKVSAGMFVWLGL